MPSGSLLFRVSLDKNNALDLTHTGSGVTGAWWHHEWTLGTGPAADRNEIVQVTVGLLNSAGTSSALDTALGTSTTFTIEVLPPDGSPIGVTRTSPIEVEKVMNLD